MASGGQFEIITAENGRKALEIFRSGVSIDLLVTDLKMPEMNGFELLVNVKKDFPATRAIALTGLITPEIKELSVHLRAKRLASPGNRRGRFQTGTSAGPPVYTGRGPFRHSSGRVTPTIRKPDTSSPFGASCP